MRSSIIFSLLFCYYYHCNHVAAVLPDECFTPIQPCPNSLDQQFCQMASYSLQMTNTNCQQICINQTSTGTQVNVNGQTKTVYCQAIFYKSPSTCKLYYQNTPGGAQGYLRVKQTRNRHVRQNALAYANQRQSWGPPSQPQQYQQGNRQVQVRQNYQPAYRNQQQQYGGGNQQGGNYQQQGGNAYQQGGVQCQCATLKPGCGKASGDNGANTTASPSATTSGASCFQGPQNKELIGSALQSYLVGDSGFDGTLATCQAACKALPDCKSLNFYAKAGDLPANCVLHDKTCASAPDACVDSSSTEYWDNNCKTRFLAVRSKSILN